MPDLPLRLAVTDCRDFARYSRWLEEPCRFAPPQPEDMPGIECQTIGLEVVRLFYRRGNADSVRECSGLVLTGGEAVNPAMYGRPEWIDRIEQRRLDDYRDLFEVQVLERALAEQIPILAVGRGMHLLNVFLGGSLRLEKAEGGFDLGNRSRVLVDRSADARVSQTTSAVVHRGNEHTEHEIEIEPGTLLESVLTPELKERRCRVLSDHDQAIDQIASELIVSAHAPDGVVEAVEWRPSVGVTIVPDLPRSSEIANPWILGLQWQLERMDSPITALVKARFIEACRGRAEHLTEGAAST